MNGHLHSRKETSKLASDIKTLIGKYSSQPFHRGYRLFSQAEPLSGYQEYRDSHICGPSTLIETAVYAFQQAPAVAIKIDRWALSMDLMSFFQPNK